MQSASRRVEFRTVCLLSVGGRMQVICRSRWGMVCDAIQSTEQKPPCASPPTAGPCAHDPTCVRLWAASASASISQLPRDLETRLCMIRTLYAVILKVFRPTPAAIVARIATFAPLSGTACICRLACKIYLGALVKRACTDSRDPRRRRWRVGNVGR